VKLMDIPLGSHPSVTKKIDQFSDHFMILHMSTTASSPQTLSVSEFKAHCTDVLRSVENTGIPLQITRHGRPVAVVCRPADTLAPQQKAKPLRDWMGSLAGSVQFAKDYDPEEPAFTPEDWEDHPANLDQP
jgi:prevent-host-death family protein